MEGWHANSPERAISLDWEKVPRWSLSNQKKKGGEGGSAAAPVCLRALTESPDQQFFGQKWSVFVLLYRKQLVWKSDTVVSVWFSETSIMRALRIRIEVHQKWGSEVLTSDRCIGKQGVIAHANRKAS